MTDIEIKKFNFLNRLAEHGGTVIFGGSEDSEIPLGELKAAFELDEIIYNRSVKDLKASEAAQVYEKYIAGLCPENILLHIGAADVDAFTADPSAFESDCRKLIGKIRESDKKCRIVILSLKNPSAKKDVAKLNRHLKYIADSERCDYEDISVGRIMNPCETKKLISFVYSTGFVHPLKNKRPIFNLIRILFCCES